MHSSCFGLGVLQLFSLIIEILYVSALIFCQQERKVYRILRFGTFIHQIGLGFACVHLTFYFYWRTQGRRNVLHLEPEDGRTKSQEIGLSFLWEFIPWAQPAPKISVS